MVLVDSSVWIAHFRAANAQLKVLLLDGQVLCHPFIIGELACGNLKDRKEILGLLKSLPQAPTAGEAEILDFIDAHRLSGIGIGLIDVHLLASTKLAAATIAGTHYPGCRFWTEDKRLRQAADKLRVAY